MTQTQDLDATFRQTSDHGVRLPEGAIVLSAQFGHVRANIWHDTTPRKVLSGTFPSQILAELDHPVWRISAGYGSIAISETVAKFRAEQIAREICGMDPDPDLFTNKASRDEIREDMMAMGQQNANAIRIQAELRSRISGQGALEPAF